MLIFYLENVEGMHTVTGWNVMNVDKCTDSNPMLENHSIIIPMDGNYYIHSQITFKCGWIIGKLVRYRFNDKPAIWNSTRKNNVLADFPHFRSTTT